MIRWKERGLKLQGSKKGISEDVEAYVVSPAGLRKLSKGCEK